MRAVVQRVRRASVTVAGTIVGTIDTGLLVLVGVTHDDTSANAVKLARKIEGLRIFDGAAAGDPERALNDLDGPAALVVSQFTLYGDASKGRRPSWSAAAPGPVAQPLVAEVVTSLRALGIHVETGLFGADMQVELINDGPMTLIVEC